MTDAIQKGLASLDRALELIAQLPDDLPCWQPIETAPKDGTNILLWQPVFDKIESLGLGHKSSDPEGGPYTGAWDRFDWRYTCAGSPFTRDDYFGDDIRPTHWMPLPAPPEN